jgi:hypothetical protein
MRRVLQCGDCDYKFTRKVRLERGPRLRRDDEDGLQDILEDEGWEFGEERCPNCGGNYFCVDSPARYKRTS